VSRIYFETFKLLARRVLRQMTPISVADETIVPISVVRGFFSSKVVVGQHTQFWEMRDRFRLLNELLSPRRSVFNKVARARAVTSEHGFTSDFLSDETITLPIFQATTQCLEHFMVNLLKQINDPVAVLFFLRFNIAHQQEMRRRNILKLEQHLTAVRAHLTERFKIIAANNLSAVTACDPAVIVTADRGPIAVAERFRDFAFAASILASEELADIVPPVLEPLSDAINGLLTRLADVVTVPSFLVNCYSLIVRGLSMVPRSAVFGFYEQNLNNATAQYLDGQLEGQLGDLVRAIKRAFAVLESSGPPTNANGIGENDLREIAIDFRDRYRQKVKEIVESHHGLFESPEIEKEIVTKLAKRVTLYSAKFIRLCNDVLKPLPAWYSGLLSAGQPVSDIQPLCS
jgi:hypothetical protein